MKKMFRDSACLTFIRAASIITLLIPMSFSCRQPEEGRQICHLYLTSNPADIPHILRKFVSFRESSGSVRDLKRFYRYDYETFHLGNPIRQPRRGFRQSQIREGEPVRRPGTREKQDAADAVLQLKPQDKTQHAESCYELRYECHST